MTVQTQPIDDTKIEFYFSTGDAWDAMYEDCVRAEKSIEFEQYILKDDAAGHRFLRLFAEKARRGISIKLMLDAIGSRSLMFSPIIEDLRRAGGIVYFYNSIDFTRILHPSEWFPRNHNKTMVIDGKVGYIGSVCLSGDMKNWRDMHARFMGRLVEQVNRHFKRMWALAALKVKTPMPSINYADGLFSYVVSHQRRHSHLLYKELLSQINKAQKSICLITPYFVPPFLLRRALTAAARRGVEIKVMVSEATDVKIADYVARTYYPKLLKNDIKVYHFQGTVLHAKYVIIDDNWATVGSANMDFLSLMINKEANIIIRNPETVMKMQAHFDADLEHCREVTMDDYRDMPLSHKIIGYLGRLIRRVI